MLEKSRSIFIKQLADSSAPLHGLWPNPGVLGMSLILVPYCGLVNRVFTRHRGSRRIDLEFEMGFWQMYDLLSLLARSIQLLGASSRRYLDSLDPPGADPRVGHTSIEVDLNEMHGYFHRSLDLKLFFDSCFSYSRIIGDCIGRTAPSIFQEPPYRFGRSSLREVRKYALKQCETPLGGLFFGDPLDWFEVLAGHVGPGLPRQREGIRDARGHHGARISIRAQGGPGLGETPDPWQLVAQQVSVKGVHSTDLLGDIGNVIGGMFGFLDRAVRLALRIDPDYDLAGEGWSKSAIIPVFGPSESLASTLPRLDNY